MVIVVVVVVITPPFPEDGGTAQTAIQVHAARLGWRLAWWGSTEKEASNLLGLRGKHQYSDQRSN